MEKERDAGLRPGTVVITKNGILTLEDIKKILPHRDPFLFVDRVLSIEPGKKISGIKKITGDEFFFKGHFPGRPILPGVIMIEALAQLGGLLMLNNEECLTHPAYFIGVNRVRFRKAVIPGDELTLEVELIRMRTRIAQMRGVLKIEGEAACEADFIFGFGP